MSEGKSKYELVGWLAGILSAACALVALGMSLKPDVDPNVAATAQAVPADARPSGPEPSAAASDDRALEIAKAQAERARIEHQMLEARLEAEARAAADRQREEDAQARDEKMHAATQRIHAALVCASSYGRVTDLQALSSEARGSGFRVQGSYSMQGQGLFGNFKVPGYFDATMAEDGSLVSLRWKEQEREEEVVEGCLGR